LSPVFQERCAALCELTSMKQAESRRKSYEWVVFGLSGFRLGVQHAAPVDEKPASAGQTHEYRLPADASTTERGNDGGTLLF
jgi:hypothetical protein